MIKAVELKDTCTACGACAAVCAAKCIHLVADDEGFYFPSVDSKQCIHCGACKQVCHCFNETAREDFPRNSYYGFSLDEEIRRTSASGGAFASLARICLAAGGNVYGAAFDYETLLLRQTSTDKVGLAALQKSKYIESYMGETIPDIQRDIDSGRKVLFCGTPCQADGVRRAVKDPDRLLTVADFICHGVPSSALFKEHLTALCKKETLLALDFRPKEKGWSRKCLKIQTDKRTKAIPFYLDPFYFGFVGSNAILRRSCYSCPYRGRHSADITIADFGGYREYDPTVNDEKGLSLLIANNEHGKRYIEGLTNFALYEIDNRYSDYLYLQKDYAEGFKKRARFYELHGTYGFEKAARKVCCIQNYRKEKLKYIIKKIMGRI